MANMFNEDGTYNKTEWKAGDKITAVKLNKIELSLEAINNNDIDRHVEADGRLDILEEQMANTPDNDQMDALEDMVKDNKDAADLAVYSINQKIESLESINADSRLDALEDINAGSILSVMDFGAVGDGVTDDTQAIKECINHAIENSKSVYIPKGVYIISPNILNFELKNNQSFILTGDGPVSILKRKDQTVTTDWCTLFRLTADDTNTSDVALIKLENIKIDSNARNQLEPDPENLFQFEHSADFYINGCSTSRINTVHLESVYATDGVADHIYIAGSTDAYVTNFIVNNFQCDYRTRTRSDLCVTGYINTAIFTNIKCIVLEYEFNNAEGLGNSYIFIDNIEAERIDLAGIGLYIKSSNMVVKENINIANLSGSIMNSMMSFKDTRLVRNPDLTFINCMFMNGGISDDTLTPLLIQHPNTISFKNCMFKIDGELESYTGNMVATSPQEDMSIYVEFDGCSFDPRVTTALYFDRSGTARVSNCMFENYCPISINSGTNYKQSITLSNIVIAGTGLSLYFEGGGTKSLQIHNMICNENNFRINTKNSASLNIDYVQVDRKIYTTVPVTVDWLMNTINGGRRFMTTLKGDKFINVNSPINEPECWTVTTTSQSFIIDTNASKLFIASGSSYGTTAERPTCYLHEGYQYFDTDLQKHVTWLGSAWSE